MGRIARAYVVLSSIAFAGLLGGACFLLAATAIVPEWVQDLSGEVSRLLEKAGGEVAETPSVRAGVPRVASVEDEPAPRASPALARDWTAPLSLEDSLPGGVGGLHTTLKALQSDIARWKDSDPREGPAEGRDLAERLEAWERIRAPLFELMASAPKSGGPGRWAQGMDIRSVSGEIAETLAAMAARKRQEARSILGRLDGRTLLRLLLEDGSLSDAEAVGYLGALPEPDALLVLDRLSRLVPDRGARLLRALADSAGASTAREISGTAKKDTLGRPRPGGAVERG
jgi:hypothetical protein